MEKTKDFVRYWHQAPIICLLPRKKMYINLCGSHAGEAEHPDLVSDVLPVPHRSYTITTIIFSTYCALLLFWYGSGPADPAHWVRTNLDPALECVRDLWYFNTNPDPAFYLSDFNMPTKSMFFHPSFLHININITEGKFSSVFQDYKLLKNHKTLKSRFLNFFFLMEGSGSLLIIKECRFQEKEKFFNCPDQFNDTTKLT